MKFYNSVGKFYIVASEVTTSKSNGKIHVIDESEFAKGKVIAEPDGDYEVSEDDEILFIRKDGRPIGHGLPANVVAVELGSIVAILDPEEDEIITT